MITNPGTTPDLPPPRCTCAASLLRYTGKHEAECPVVGVSSALRARDDRNPLATWVKDRVEEHDSGCTCPADAPFHDSHCPMHPLNREMLACTEPGSMSEPTSPANAELFDKIAVAMWREACVCRMKELQRGSQGGIVNCARNLMIANRDAIALVRTLRRLLKESR